jgi:hypothetical protein
VTPESGIPTDKSKCGLLPKRPQSRATIFPKTRVLRNIHQICHSTLAIAYHNMFLIDTPAAGQRKQSTSIDPSSGLLIDQSSVEFPNNFQNLPKLTFQIIRTKLQNISHP